MQKYTVREALNLIKEGSLIKPKNHYSSGRRRLYQYGGNYIEQAPFPAQGLTVRKVKINKQYTASSGDYEVPVSYELYFEEKPDTFYITHSQIDFESSILDASPKKTIERKIENIEKSIEKNLKEIEEKKSKVDKARGEIVRLKSKLTIMSELGEEVDEDTLDAYVMVKNLRSSDKLTDLEVAKELIKFKKA